MAKQRVEASINVRQSQQGRREVNRVERDLDRIERKAKSAQREAREAKTAFPPSRSLDQRISAFKNRLGKSGPRASLTTEGLVAGPFKISDTGFNVEGLWATLGGPMVAAVALGRIASALSGAATGVREIKKAGDQFGIDVSTTEAFAAGAVDRGTDVARQVLFGITGIESIVGDLIALGTDSSRESVQAATDLVFKRFADGLKSRSILEIEEAQIRFQAEQAAEQYFVQAVTSTEELLQSWSVPPGALSKVRAQLAVPLQEVRRSTQRREEERLRLAAELGTDGGGE